MSAYSNDLRGNDVIDSRDVIARIDELESERDALLDDGENADSDELATIDEELEALKSLAEDVEGFCEDWTFGATLIRDDHFEDYAKDMLEDVGTLPRDLPWYIEIDWATTAENLKADYTSVDFDGETYLVR